MASRARLTVCIATLALTIAACSDPPVGAPAAQNVPTPLPTETHLRGKILDLATGAPIAGAAVTAAGVATQSDSQGNYNLQRLRAAELMTTRAGYDTARSFIPLVGGDQEFIVRMRARAAAAAAARH